MKRIIFALISICSASFSNAQSFSIPHDTVSATVTTSMNMYNNMTNISGSDIFVDWWVAAHNLPADWAATFAICDNYLCYYNINNTLLSGNTFTTDTISPAEVANFYVLPDLTNATTFGTFYVKVEMIEGSITIPSWYIISKWATGVNTVTYRNTELVVYPNPVMDKLNILIDDKLKVNNIVVTDITGKVLANNVHSGNSSSFSTADLGVGMYFLKAIDAEGKTVASTKFNKL